MALIFIHIPKTGGTSIRTALYGKHGYGHMRAVDVNTYGNKMVSCVRNPYDRAVSIYGHIQNGGKVYKEGFVDFILSGGLQNQALAGNEVTIASPCCDYICNSEGEIIVDHLLRFESLVDDFKSLTGMGIGWHNASNRDKDYMQYYNTKARDTVKNFYAKDFEIFEYE